MRLTLLVWLIGGCAILNAQEPVISWEKTFGGSDKDIPFSIQQTKDKGYIVAGYTGSYDGDIEELTGRYSYWILKLDPSGNIQWKNTYGGSSYNFARSIEQTEDGGYIVAGSTNSDDGDVSKNPGERSVWVLKLDPSGNIEWENAFGGSHTDYAYSIQQIQDGGYIVAGDVLSEDGDVSNQPGSRSFWVLRLSEQGKLEWEKALGGTSIDRANTIQQTNDSGFIVTGETWSTDGDVANNPGQKSWWVVKLSNQGQLQWENTYGGSKVETSNDILQTSDGNFIVAGNTTSDGGDISKSFDTTDVWIISIDQQGELLWEKTYGGSAIDKAYSLDETQKNDFIIGGYTMSDNGHVSENPGPDTGSYWLFKIDKQGRLKWEQTHGGSNVDIATSVSQTQNGHYIVAGLTWSNDGDVSQNPGSDSYWILKLSELPKLGADTTLCQGDSLTLGPIQFPADSIGWSTGETGDSIVVSDSGTYQVTVKTDSNTYSDTVEVATAPRPHVYIGPNKQAFCGKIDHTFTPETKNVNTFQWNTGDTTKTLHVDQEGTYWLRVESEGACANADTSDIQALQTPKGFTNEQVAVCEGEVELDAGNPKASFEWSTGQTARKIRVDKEGTYTVKIANDYCTIKDTIEVQLNEESACPYLYIPNAFTPDGDGLNDVFKPGYQNIRNFRMVIYNRWGEQVFETNDITEGWDGTYQGSKVPEGQYLYNIVYHYKEKGFIRTNTKSGILQVVK